MNGKHDQSFRTLKILFIAAVLFAAVLMIWSSNSRFNAVLEEEGKSMNPVDISQEWKLIKNGEEIGTVSFPYELGTEPNDVIEFQKVLPRAEMSVNAVCFHTNFSAVEVLAENTPIYRYDASNTRPFGKAPPSHWNLVWIPQWYDGQSITVRISSPYKDCAGTLTPVWMGNPLLLNGYLLKGYVAQYLNCGIFLALGIALAAGSFFMQRIVDDLCSVRSLGIFVSLTSLWMMSEIDFPDLLWFNGFTSSVGRYLLMMLCPIVYLLYLHCRFPEKYKTWLRGLCYLFTCNFFVLTLCQILNLADFPETACVTHGCMMLMMAVIFLIIGKRFLQEHPISFQFATESIGITILSLSLMGEIYLYHRGEYLRSGDYMRLGMLAYSGCLTAALTIDIKNKREETQRIGRELQESRLRLMISQIQPHFIYNTLSSVRTLIKLEPDKAYDLVYNFSKYLRANIDSIGQEGMIPFSKEMEHIKSYCDIEKIRFGDKLSLVYDIQVVDFLVPPLTVQPLVENAIKHGIRGRVGGGTVRIRSFVENGQHVIEVMDDGIGFHVEETVPKNSAGLANIRFRLKEIADARLEITSIPGKGTKAVIWLPKEQGGRK